MTSKYTKSARGQQCQVRLPGVCNSDPATVVLAHLNGGGGGMKHIDIHGAYACSDCHDAVDGRVKSDIPRDDLVRWHMEGVFRTQVIMVREGILKL